MQHNIDIFGLDIEAAYDKETNSIILYCRLPEVPTPDSTGIIYAHLTEGVQHKYFQLPLERSKLIKVVPDEPEITEAEVAAKIEKVLPSPATPKVIKINLEGE